MEERGKGEERVREGRDEEGKGQGRPPKLKLPPDLFSWRRRW